MVANSYAASAMPSPQAAVPSARLNSVGCFELRSTVCFTPKQLFRVRQDRVIALDESDHPVPKAGADGKQKATEAGSGSCIRNSPNVRSAPIAVAGPESRLAEGGHCRSDRSASYYVGTASSGALALHATAAKL